MPEENNNQPLEEQRIIVGSGTGPQLQESPLEQPKVKSHRLLKIWLVISLLILVLNSWILLLMFVPFIGVFVAIGAAPILLATGVLGLINLIVVSRALSKKYLTGAFRKIAIAIVVLSVPAVLAGSSAPFTLFAMHKANQDGDKIAAYYDEQEATARSEVTVEEATKLLNDCKVFGFYYTAQNGVDGSENAEKTSSGVLLYYVGKSYDDTTTPSSNNAGKYRMHIADRLIDTMVPLARNAQRTCGIQFWHDGTYEQYKNGQWYFKDQVVQNVEPGKSKEEAIAFMRDCRADYFVGYTDIGLIKDSNSKTWLEKAEKSTSGIEILEDSPKSYVFASKAMTASLQDTARQYRQACYSKKKLYITVDN
jgi:flagellar basal body-associated protein FliL